MSKRLGYEHVMKLFSPGYAVAEASHPILSNLQNPHFNRILNQTDQVVYLLNHTTFQYEYVSENVESLTGYTAQEFVAGGLEFAFKVIHPDDVHALNSTVYPEFLRAITSVKPELRAQVLLTYTCRLVRKDGSQVMILEKAIPLTFEGDKVLLGLITLSDISAFKRDTNILYRNAILTKGQPPIVISQGESRSGMFTDREMGILELSAEGLTEKEIADRLSLSVFTIKTHKKKMFAKADVTNTAGLIHFASANLVI